MAIPDDTPYMDFPEIHIPVAERLAYILGGKAVFTIQSHNTGRAFTYRIQSAKKDKTQQWSTNNQDRSTFFVSLLIGPDNSEDFQYFAFLRRTNTHNMELRTKEPYSTAFKNFHWIWNAIVAESHEDSYDFLPSRACARCGRTLTVAESIRAGFGPECAGKE